MSRIELSLLRHQYTYRHVSVPDGFVDLILLPRGQEHVLEDSITADRRSIIFEAILRYTKIMCALYDARYNWN